MPSGLNFLNSLDRSFSNGSSVWLVVFFYYYKFIIMFLRHFCI